MLFKNNIPLVILLLLLFSTQIECDTNINIDMG